RDLVRSRRRPTVEWRKKYSRFPHSRPQQATYLKTSVLDMKASQAASHPALRRRPAPVLSEAGQLASCDGLGCYRFVAARHIENIVVVPANRVAHRSLDYSHPRSPNAERSTRDGAYHPAEL